MKCALCDVELKRGEELKWERKIVCEDCYLDAAIPVYTCDPESVRMARNMESLGFASGEVSERQAQILEIIKETGGTTHDDLADRLQINLNDLKIELAALRHMRKVKGEKRGEQHFVILYGD